MKRRCKQDKRAVSPVIATVLLISMVVVLALIIFVWMRALAQETITKFEGENIELSCDKVSFDASWSGTGGILTIRNTGNVPIYQIKMKVSEPGKHTTNIIEKSQGWPKYGIDTGRVFNSESGKISFSGADEVLLIPVLIGDTEDGKKKTFTCDERFGYKVIQ